MPPVNTHDHPPSMGSCVSGRPSEWELGKPVQSPVILLSYESHIHKAANSDEEGNGKPPHYYIFPGQIIMAETNKTMALSPRQILNGQRVRRISGSAIKIATWNVRSLYEDGKLENVIQEMSRLEFDILGISELRWIGNGKLTSGDATIYYSGSNDSQHHRNGVAVLIKAALQSNVRNFVPISDRVMLLQLEAKPFHINIVQVYAPTADKSDEIIEAFYGDIDTALKITKKHELTIVTGDFNSKIGQGSVPDAVGSFGLGVRNDRGERLIQFCQENDFVITNTFFKLPPRRLYTWRSPADDPEKIVRNQIDFFLINKRYRNSIKSAKTYPGANIGSDHNPVVAIVNVRLKQICHRPETAKINLDKLRNPELRKQLHLAINDEMCRLKQENYNTNRPDMQQAWCDFKKTVLDTGMHILVPTPQINKTKWITQEILDLMDERRKNKVNKEKYDRIQHSIRSKIRQAKEAWYGDLCSEIEELDKKFDSFNMHKKIQELIAPKHQGRIQTTLLNKDGSYASCTDDMLVTWEQYIKELFHDTRAEPVEFVSTDMGPAITRREIYHAISKSKTRKAVGPDDIPVDIIKEIDECNLDYFVNLFNAIYDSGIIPSDWLKSTFITLPKIKNPKKCVDYQTISLISHVLKLFMKVIYSRIYSKCMPLISPNQFGFRSGLGTRDALFGYQVLVQRCWDMNRDLFVCFIDYEKAFDRVQHVKLMEVLHKCGLDYKDYRFVKNLYWKQNANIKVNGKISSYIEVERGVRQGCILSPLLFNLYAEAIFSEALDGSPEGILINGKLLNNIRYADDTLLIADSLEGLQSLVDLVASGSAKYSININTKKTKYMIVSRTPELVTSLWLNGQGLERVSKFRYLGVMVDDRGDNSLEIRCNAFSRMKKVLCDRNLSITLRTRIARCFVFSVLLYGVEAWTLTEVMVKKLEAFEMWVYRRMLRISWTDRVRNSTVLQRMRKTPEVLMSIKERKLQYFGHVMRNARKYELLQLIIQGKVAGRRRPGRRRISWLKNLRQWFGRSTRSLFRAAISKVEIAIMIANLRKETAR